MKFTLTLDLLPGTSYAEIKRQIELVAEKSIPTYDGTPITISRDINIATGTSQFDVHGHWRIEQ